MITGPSAMERDALVLTRPVAELSERRVPTNSNFRASAAFQDLSPQLEHASTCCEHHHQHDAHAQAPTHGDGRCFGSAQPEFEPTAFDLWAGRKRANGLLHSSQTDGVALSSAGGEDDPTAAWRQQWVGSYPCRSQHLSCLKKKFSSRAVFPVRTLGMLPLAQRLKSQQIRK